MGRCSEWLMGVDCKSAGYTYVGSNPTRPKLSRKFAFNFYLKEFPPSKVPSKTDAYQLNAYGIAHVKKSFKQVKTFLNKYFMVQFQKFFF